MVGWWAFDIFYITPFLAIPYLHTVNREIRRLIERRLIERRLRPLGTHHEQEPAAADTEADKELPRAPPPHSPGCTSGSSVSSSSACSVSSSRAFTVPVLAIWYGAPTLSLTEICDEFMKVRWNDEKAEMQVPAPDRGPAVRWSRWTHRPQHRQDRMGRPAQVPPFDRIGFRELVRNKEEREAREKAAAQAKEQQSPTPSGTQPAGTPATQSQKPVAQLTTRMPQSAAP